MSSRNRIRYRNTDLNVSYKSDIFDRVNGNCNVAAAWRTYGTATAIHKIGMISSMTDVLIPGYRSRSAKGEVFFNPMESVTMHITPGTGTTPPEFKNISPSCSNQGLGAYNIKYRYPMTGSTIGRDTCGFEFIWNSQGMLAPPPSFLSEMEINMAIKEASTAALNKRGRTDSNLYETVAEINKTLRLIPDIVRSNLKVLDRYRDILDRARNTGNAYLAYRYGVKPLLSDLEAVQKGLLAKIGRVRKTSRGSVSLQAKRTERKLTNYTGACTSTQTWTHIEDFSVRAMSLDEYTVGLLHNIGFTDKGLATLPWELLPYSFVADWIVNFGEFIGSLVPVLNSNQLGSCIVQKRVLTTSYEIGNTIPNYGLETIAPISGTCERIWSSTRRDSTPLNGSLVIKADFRLTEITRALDALALVLQKIR